jgi:hypothetical protein
MCDGMDLEGSSHGLNILFHRLMERQENLENSQYMWCPGHDVN